MDKALTDAEARIEHRKFVDNAYVLLTRKKKTPQEQTLVNKLFDMADELYAQITRGHFVDDDLRSTRERSQI
jgi:hypothetical protein